MKMFQNQNIGQSCLPLITAIRHFGKHNLHLAIIIILAIIFRDTQTNMTFLHFRFIEWKNEFLMD